MAKKTNRFNFLGIEEYQLSDDEKYMNEAQQQHFLNILSAWRTQLMEQADETMHLLQEEGNNLPDPADRATILEEISGELKTRNRERKLIKKIDLTLDQIAENNYGYCISCAAEIGIRRLEARPTAILCIDCKTLQEIAEKQGGA